MVRLSMLRQLLRKCLMTMVKQGARRSKIASKYAGGAQVFKHMNLEILKIGNRNAISVEETLIKNKIPILAKDVGGEVGRNVIFNPVDGSMIVKYTKGGILVALNIEDDFSFLLRKASKSSGSCSD